MARPGRLGRREKGKTIRGRQCPVESGFAQSEVEARRTIQQGGASANNRRIDDVEAMLTSADLAGETVLVRRSGKKKYALLLFGEY